MYIQIYNNKHWAQRFEVLCHREGWLKGFDHGDPIIFNSFEDAFQATKGFAKRGYITAVSTIFNINKTGQNFYHKAPIWFEYEN